MKLNNPSSKLLYFIFFMTFAGYNSILLVIFHLGMYEASRLVTIPVRVAIDGALLVIFLLNIRTARLSLHTTLFILFAFFYYARITIHTSQGDSYHLSSIDLYLYFTSFAVIPFLLMSSIRYKPEYFQAIINSMLLSNFIFPVITYFTYKSHIGHVGRLGQGLDTGIVISPLALSYTSAMGIGVITLYLLYNRTSILVKIFGVISIGLGFIPYFLGSSRGSVFALFVPFIFIFFDKLKVKQIVYGAVAFVVILTSLYFLTERYNSALFERFLSIKEDVEEAKMSASRVDIWDKAFNQFLESPYIGGKLEIAGLESDYHAHNVFIEVLQTTGLAGFTPFVLLILAGFWNSLKIIRLDSRYFWVAVIYTQSVLQSCFTGSVVAAAWLWTSLALVFATARYIDFAGSQERLMRSQYNYDRV